MNPMPDISMLHYNGPVLSPYVIHFFIKLILKWLFKIILHILS